MKSADVKKSTHINFVENKDKDPKFKVDDNVTISKCKDIFAKGYTSNSSEDVSAIKNVKDSLPSNTRRTNAEEIFGKFYEYHLQKSNDSLNSNKENR